MNVLPAELGNEIRRLAQSAMPPSFEPILQKVNTYLAGVSAESFAQRKSPDGTPWPGTADLVESGKLKQELTDPGKGVIEGNKLERSTDLPQASFAMAYGVPKTGKGGGGGGSGRRRKKRRQLASSSYRTPPRPAIGHSDIQADAIGNIVAEYIVNQWAKNAS